MMKKDLRKILNDYRGLNLTTVEELKNKTNIAIDKIFKVFIRYMKQGNRE